MLTKELSLIQNTSILKPEFIEQCGLLLQNTLMLNQEFIGQRGLPFARSPSLPIIISEMHPC
ncbi:MAG: hypothetical protein JO131_01240 [Gammaproteobacteria bacterium]|nr:hypothetical protein [Gammaproteobacteria bacterium]